MFSPISQQSTMDSFFYRLTACWFIYWFYFLAFRVWSLYQPNLDPSNITQSSMLSSPRVNFFYPGTRDSIFSNRVTRYIIPIYLSFGMRHYDRATAPSDWIPHVRNRIYSPQYLLAPISRLEFRGSRVSLRTLAQHHDAADRVLLLEEVPDSRTETGGGNFVIASHASFYRQYDWSTS